MRGKHITILWIKIFALVLVLALIPFSLLLTDSVKSKARFLKRDIKLTKDETIVRHKYGNEIVEHLLKTHKRPDIVNCLAGEDHIWAYDGIYIAPVGNFRPDNSRELYDKKIYHQITASTAEVVQQFLDENGISAIHDIAIKAMPNDRPELAEPAYKPKNNFPLQYIVISEYPDITLFFFIVKKTHNFAPTYNFSRTIKFKTDPSGKIPDITVETRKIVSELLPTICPGPGIVLNCFMQ